MTADLVDPVQGMVTAVRNLYGDEAVAHRTFPARPRMIRERSLWCFDPCAA